MTAAHTPLADQCLPSYENDGGAAVGFDAVAALRTMATTYPVAHPWDKLDARACIRGALEIERQRAQLATLRSAYVGASDRIAALLAENAKLLAENAKLLAENAKLRAEAHDLNWALGTPGYEQMHDPADQALSEAAHADVLQRIEAMRAHKARVDTVMALISSPEMENFLRGTHLEAVHQVDRWGTAHDRAKRPADWFWLVGYLAGKALHAATAGDQDKARNHCISTAAALYNWHCAIRGLDVRMCPGRSDVAEIVDAAFPGEGGA